MSRAISSLFRSFVSLLYPPLCLHCQDGLFCEDHLFCEECLKLLELITPEERCPYCFSPEYSDVLPTCKSCRNKKPLLNRIAAAFDYAGPAATLVKQMKYGGQPHLAKGAGAYLAVQFLQLNWPPPDYIIPVPMPFMRWLDRGYNQSLLLAQALGKIIQCPVKNALKRKGVGFSQAGQSLEQRNQLGSEQFAVKKGQRLQDKCILLVDDVLTTGSTFRCCAEVILAECPSNIYGLTLCQTIK